jgi:hypothetical protein
MLRHITLATIIGATQLVAQQTTTDGAARFFAYRVTPALDQQFVDGYERHLQWHATAHDTFVWCCESCKAPIHLPRRPRTSRRCVRRSGGSGPISAGAGGRRRSAF